MTDRIDRIKPQLAKARAGATLEDYRESAQRCTDGIEDPETPEGHVKLLHELQVSWTIAAELAGIRAALEKIAENGAKR